MAKGIAAASFFCAGNAIALQHANAKKDIAKSPAPTDLFM